MIAFPVCIFITIWFPVQKLAIVYFCLIEYPGICYIVEADLVVIYHQNVILIFITFETWIYKPPRLTIQLFRQIWKLLGLSPPHNQLKWQAVCVIAGKCEDTA